MQSRSRVYQMEGKLSQTTDLLGSNHSVNPKNLQTFQKNWMCIGKWETCKPFKNTLSYHRGRRDIREMIREWEMRSAQNRHVTSSEFSCHLFRIVMSPIQNCHVTSSEFSWELKGLDGFNVFLDGLVVFCEEWLSTVHAEQQVAPDAICQDSHENELKIAAPPYRRSHSTPAQS
jgi:hypothetical protein